VPFSLPLRRFAGPSLVFLLASTGARAQTVTLPQITVTAPSPIVSGSGNAGGGFADGELPVVPGTFSSVTVVPRADIIRQQPTTLGDALADRPGISGSTYAPGAANRPIIRGLDNFRVRIQENGIGVQDVSTIGEDHAVPINPLVNDRIEVIRGPATLRYGSQAIGGVVSAENSRIPTSLPVDGYSGQVLGGLSSAERGRNGAASIDIGANNVALHVDGFITASDDYGTPLGRQINSAARAQGGAAGLSYIGHSGFAGFGYSHYNALYGIPGGDAAASRTRLDPTQDKLFSRGEYRFDSGLFEAVRFWLGASDYKHNERGLDDAGIDSIRATFTNRQVEGRVEVQHVPVQTVFGTLVGAAGVQGDLAKLGTSGEAGGLLSPTDTRSLAGYLFEQLQLGAGLRLQASGRIEAVRAAGTTSFFPASFLPSFSPTGEVGADGNPLLAADALAQSSFTRRFTPKSAGFGILQDLPFGFVGSISGQYVERAPAAAELFSRGSHDATATFEIGDPNLKLERARTVEIGLRRAEGPLRVDATGYFTRYTDFIYRRVTGVRCDEEFSSCGGDGSLQQIVFTQQNAIFFGAEIATQWDAIHTDGGGVIGVDAQYDFVRAQFDDGTFVPRIPPHRLGGGFFWRENGLFARVNVLHAFDQRQIAANETTTDGYTLLRAELSYTQPTDRKKSGIREFTIGIRGDNLLDEQVRNAASFRKDEILLPGRSVRLFLHARF